MRKECNTIPPSMEGMETYGFSWMEFVAAIPAPLFVVTSYKSNGKPNACMQSWACFHGEEQGFYAILSSVNKRGHLYQTVKEKGDVVLNFPSAEVHSLCMKTIENNDFDDDEISLSGLTAEPATMVDAPRIKECFLSLESQYAWEREIVEGSEHVLMCFQVINICVDEAHLDESGQGRYGESGYLYNIHYPINPESFVGKSCDYIGILQKVQYGDEY